MQVSAVGYCFWGQCLSSLPIALQGRERTCGGSAGARSEKLDRNTPVLRSDQRDSNIRYPGERENREPGVQQPSESAAERVSDGGQDVGDARDPVQSGKSRGESRVPVTLQSILTTATSRGKRLG